MTEEEILTKLLRSVVKVSNITIDQVLSREKEKVVSFARGLFCYMAREMNIHPVKIAKVLQRSRSSCITTAKSYKGYIESGDKVLIELVKKIKEELNNE